MNIDVLMHAALLRLGPVKLEWKRGETGSFFRVTAGDGTTNWWAVDGSSWPEVWERFILEAVARR